MHTTSHSLLEQLRQPAADESWTRFVQLYAPLLFSWARRARLQESDAADLVQEIFTLLVQKLPEFEHNRTGSFRAWLRAVTMNKLRDWKRRAARVAIAPLDGDQVADSEADCFWEQDFRRELAQRALELMRAEFEPATWQAFWEFVTTGKSAAEVAREFDISENAVYIAKCRVIRRLRQELRGMLD
jgi:RNA polymerase sigma-70 factor (ECF subfamily)